MTIVDSREALTAPLSERLTFGNYVMAASSAIVVLESCIKNSSRARYRGQLF